MYISAGLVAWISGLFVILSLVKAKHGYRTNHNAIKQAIARADKASARAEKMAEEIVPEIEKVKQKQLLFEESLTSFTNRISARKPRPKDRKPEEVLAEELMKQTGQLNNGQQEMELEPKQPKRLVPLS